MYLCESSRGLSVHSSRLAPGSTVTRPGQIPHPSAQVLTLVMVVFDKRHLESKEIHVCILEFGNDCVLFNTVLFISTQKQWR